MIQNRKQAKNLKKWLCASLMGFSITVSQGAFSFFEINPDKGCPPVDGWKITSAGGVRFTHPEWDNYSFAVGGVVRYDSVAFSGSYRDKGASANWFPFTGFPSSANLRTVELQVSGGLGDRFGYMVDILFQTKPVGFNDTYLSYKVIPDMFDVAVGRLSGNYNGLENAYGTTWMPFMERSLHAQAFYPGDGIGIRAELWGCDGALKAVLLQTPDQGDSALTTNSNATVIGRDRTVATLRATYAPVHNPGDVWHFGVVGVYREATSDFQGIPVSAIVLRTNPGLRNRFNTRSVSTGFLRSNYDYHYSLEFRRQCGPFALEANHTNMFVHRIGDTRGTLNFDGWLIQTRYTLTGEVHEYDVKDGALGGLKPCSPWGAWEVALRYDVLNLNDKNVQGGDEHNLAFALNWYINEQVRLSGNYIRANIMVPNTAVKRYLDMFGFRAQVRFK